MAADAGAAQYVLTQLGLFTFYLDLIRLGVHILILLGVSAAVAILYQCYNLLKTMGPPRPLRMPQVFDMIGVRPFIGGLPGQAHHAGFHPIPQRGSFPIIDHGDPSIPACQRAQAEQDDAVPELVVSSDAEKDGERAALIVEDGDDDSGGDHDSVAAAAAEAVPSSDGLTVAACCICTEQRPDHMLVPCHHLALCGTCAPGLAARRMARCPLCQQQISECIRVYYG